MVEEPQVVVHQAHQPDFIADLLDADVPAGEDRAQVDLAPAEADAAALSDGEGAVVERVVESVKAPIAVRVKDGPAFSP